MYGYCAKYRFEEVLITFRVGFVGWDEDYFAAEFDCVSVSEK